MRVGFSGTREGMTKAQAAAVAFMLRALGVAVELHPPSNPALRAFCEMRPGEVVRDEAPYLARNANIAAATEALIACPCGEVGEETRSGTWWTVRAARRLGRPVAVVRPSGRVERERWPL